jgi:hypothetical protein
LARQLEAVDAGHSHIGDQQVDPMLAGANVLARAGEGPPGIAPISPITIRCHSLGNQPLASVIAVFREIL